GTGLPSIASRDGSSIAGEYLDETRPSIEESDERNAWSLEHQLSNTVRITSVDDGSAPDLAVPSCPTSSNSRASQSPAEDQFAVAGGGSNDLGLGGAGQQFSAALAEVRRRGEEALQAAERRRSEEIADLSAALTSQGKAHTDMLSRARDAEAGRLVEAER